MFIVLLSQKKNRSYSLSVEPLTTPQLIIHVGTVPLGFLQHCAAFSQRSLMLDLRVYSCEWAGVCVHEGFTKGTLPFEKRIHLLAKRKLKRDVSSVGSNRKK